MKTFILLATLILLNSCGLAKAIDYSFYVPEHEDYEFDGKCYGIENQPGESLLITDCGGYANVFIATISLGLSRSSEEVAETYTSSSKEYLDSKYEGCKITKWVDLGGKVFEVSYMCESFKEITQ